MERTTRATALAVGLLLVAGAALAESRALIADGSFEQGPPPGSAWTETADVDCERIGDHSGDWYVSAYHGSSDYWAAGFCFDELSGDLLPVTGEVTQALTIPADSTVLTFYYIAFRPTSDDSPLDGDRAYVAVNGAELWTLPLIQANDSYPNWVGPVELDLGAYAGQSVELAIGGVSEGEATGNARIDYLELVPGSTATAIQSWSAVKALYR